MALPPLPMTPPGIGSAGAAGPRTGSPGMAADAMTKVREAVHLLEMALPGLPVGSEPHKAVLKMIQDGSKIAPTGQENGGVQQATLAGLMDRAKQMQQLQALQGSMAPGGQPPAGGPPSGGAAGAPPPSPPGM